MNAEILEKAGIDYDKGVKRFLGNALIYEKVLSKFPKDPTFDRVRADYEANDREALLADAHEFKGMCGNIAINRAYEAADALVKLLRGQHSKSDIDLAYSRLEAEYNLAREAVLASSEVSA